MKQNLAYTDLYVRKRGKPRAWLSLEEVAAIIITAGMHAVLLLYVSFHDLVHRRHYYSASQRYLGANNITHVPTINQQNQANQRDNLKFISLRFIILNY